jgi:nucleotide-binding universal stress UspA family protein
MPQEDLMGLRDILVHLDDGRGHETRLRVACELARRQNAHLTGMFVVEPVSVAALAAPPGADFAQVEVLQAIQEKHRAARSAVGTSLAGAFRRACDSAGISSAWRVAEGHAADLVTAQTRYVDLAILGQRDPDTPAVGGPVAEAAMLGSGRPVLVIPYVGECPTIGQRVMVAWTASREAARAVNDAIPLLRDAEMVMVLTVNLAEEADTPGTDIAQHLARHGIKAEASYTVAEDVAVGEILLSRAADFGSDLIVMGGYGHSRLRELVLGGATRMLLGHMTVPVLLSH